MLDKLFKTKESKHIALFMAIYCVFAVFGFISGLLHTFYGVVIYQVFLICLVSISYLIWHRKNDG